MRPDEASSTARGVAVLRSMVGRPEWETGDGAADDRLVASLAAELRQERGDWSRRADSEFFASFTVRTRFFDAAVVRALRDGVDQVVVLGAGYDGRALRFRTPGVRFFEVDHPATQAEKRRLLSDIDASVDDIAFVTADFTKPGLADALDAAGHDPQQRTQFLCEGVLRYLPEEWVRELLRVTAARGAPGSDLAVSISTRDREATEGERAREQALAESGEPVLTVPPAGVALEWLAAAGWTVASIEDTADHAPVSRRGRLLVHARR